MRRIAAGTAVSLLAALAIGGPLASAAHAGPTSLQCATAAPPTACALLDDLAAQLGPIAPLVVAPLDSSTATAQGFAARSDQPAGVPTAEVVGVSRTLLAQLAELPAPVTALVGDAGLDRLTDTLQALVAELTAPVAPDQQSSAGSSATPAARSGATGAPVAPAGERSGSTGSYGGSVSGSGSSSAPSSAAVPDVPVGDPLALGPLALPDFGFDTSFEPALTPAAAEMAAEEAAVAEVIDGLSEGSRAAELAVVVVLSLLLLAGAGVAQVQANRHTIPD